METPVPVKLTARVPSNLSEEDLKPFQITGVRIICDSCDEESPKCKDTTAALEMAAKYGWKHTEEGLDYCPDCKEEA